VTWAFLAIWSAAMAYTLWWAVQHTWASVGVEKRRHVGTEANGGCHPAPELARESGQVTIRGNDRNARLSLPRLLWLSGAMQSNAMKERTKCK